MLSAEVDLIMEIKPRMLDYLSVIMPPVLILVTAWLAARIAIMQLRLHSLTSLLVEISGQDASRDRGLVRRLSRTDTGHIRDLVKAGREGSNNPAGHIGAALERTIARLDRVAFFLIGNHGWLERNINRLLCIRPANLSVRPPIWLRTHVTEVWERVRDWVIFRQTTDDQEFQHEHYAHYLRQLAEMQW